MEKNVRKLLKECGVKLPSIKTLALQLLELCKRYQKENMELKQEIKRRKKNSDKIEKEVRLLFKDLFEDLKVNKVQALNRNKTK